MCDTVLVPPFSSGRRCTQLRFCHSGRRGVRKQKAGVRPVLRFRLFRRTLRYRRALAVCPTWTPGRRTERNCKRRAVRKEDPTIRLKPVSRIRSVQSTRGIRQSLLGDDDWSHCFTGAECRCSHVPIPPSARFPSHPCCPARVVVSIRGGRAARGLRTPLPIRSTGSNANGRNFEA
jgi:hypothetical protein